MQFVSTQLVYIVPVWAPIALIALTLILHIVLALRSKDYTLLPLIVSEAWFLSIYLLSSTNLITEMERMAMIRTAIMIQMAASALRTALKLFGDRIWNSVSRLQAKARHEPR